MRNARFRPDGTLEAGAALRNQRQFWFLGFQALPFLETTFRLTDRLNGTTGQGTTNDRAFDLKVQLWREGPWRPALAIGLQDAIGTGHLWRGIPGGLEAVRAARRVPRHGLGAARHRCRPAATRWAWSGPATRPGRGMSARAARQPMAAVPWRGCGGVRRGGMEPADPGSAGSRGCAPSSNGRATRCATSAAAIPRDHGLRGRARSRLNLGLQWQPNPWLDAGVHFVHGTDRCCGSRCGWTRRGRPRCRAAAAAPCCRARRWGPGHAIAPAPARRRLPPARRRSAGPEARIAVERRALPDPGPGRRPGRPHRRSRCLPPEVERLRSTGTAPARPSPGWCCCGRRWRPAPSARAAPRRCWPSATLLPAGPFPGAAPGPDLGARAAAGAATRRPEAAVRWQAGLAAGPRWAGRGLRAGRQRGPGGGREPRRTRKPSDSQLPHVRSDLGPLCAGGQDGDPDPLRRADLDPGAGLVRPGHRRAAGADVPAASPARCCGGRSNGRWRSASTSPGWRSGSTGSGFSTLGYRSSPGMPRSMPTCRYGT